MFPLHEEKLKDIIPASQLTVGLLDVYSGETNILFCFANGRGKK